MSTSNGSIVDAFKINDIDGDVISVSQNPYNPMTEEIVVYYSKGELWKIHIIEKTSIWYKLDHYRFVSLLYAWDGAETAYSNQPKYVGIVNSKFFGLIDMENLNNNHLIISDIMESYCNINEYSCAYGGITSKIQNLGEYVFYYITNKGSQIYVGNLDIDGIIFKSYKIYKSRLYIDKYTYVDINFKISIGEQNNTVLWIKINNRLLKFSNLF